MTTIDPEDQPLTLRILRPILREEISKAVVAGMKEIIEFIGVIHEKLDTKIDNVRDELKQDIGDSRQELYETKVELRNEIRSSQKEFDHRLTRLETRI